MDRSVIPIIESLEELFDIMNNHFFSGTLPKPIIVASTAGKKNAYGWCTNYRAWTDKEMKDILSPSDALTEEEKKIIAQEDGYYEINICAEYLNRSFEDICVTLLHEMVHLYNLKDGVSDTSRFGLYHNRNYKEAAEKHGLHVEKTKYGWSETSLTYPSLEFVRLLDKDKFDLHRRPKSTSGEEERKPSKQSMRKYICPECGCIIRATKEVSVICKTCSKVFLEVQKDPITGVDNIKKPEEEQTVFAPEIEYDNEVLADVQNELDPCAENQEPPVLPDSDTPSLPVPVEEINDQLRSEDNNQQKAS